MKFVLYDDHRLGVLRGDDVVDVNDLVIDGPHQGDGVAMERLIAAWPDLRPRLEDAVRDRDAVGGLAATRVRAPVPQPRKVVCMVASYRENTEHPAQPISGFLASPQALLDPGGTVELPPVEFPVCHHEAELVVVIGARARNVDQSDALEHVFGYTCGVDVSARQTFPTSTYLGKSWDTFKPVGTCVTTADEVPDPQDLQIQLRVNGELHHDFNTSDMGYPVAEMIQWWSSIMTLMPGDLIFTGTNHQGIGRLQGGDEVEMTIDRVGSLGFHVEDRLGRTWPTGIDEGVARAMRERVVAAAMATTAG